MRQRLRYIRKNGEGKQRQQHKKGEIRKENGVHVYVCVKLSNYLNMVWATKQKDLIKSIKDTR